MVARSRPGPRQVPLRPSVPRGGARIVIGTQRRVARGDLGLVTAWDEVTTPPPNRAPIPDAREVAMLRAPPTAPCGVDRRQRPYRRGAGAGAQSMGARPGRGPFRRAVRSPRGSRSTTVAMSRSVTRGPDRPAAVGRLTAAGPRCRPVNAGAGSGPASRLRVRPGVRACRTISRCRHCTGPMSPPDRETVGAVCRWCGREEARRCAVRAAGPTGARRRGRRPAHRRGTR